MDKQTLSNYGWIVIAVLVLAVMIALATPFGSYIKTGVENTTQGLFDTSEKALNVVGMSAGDGSFDSTSDNDFNETLDLTPISAPAYGTNDPLLNHTGIIPEGGSYWNISNPNERNDDGIADEGMSFPTFEEGNEYHYGDYI